MDGLDRWAVPDIRVASVVSRGSLLKGRQGVPGGLQSVLRHGADPRGSRDSSPAFDAAFRALPPQGGTIRVPAGRYRLGSPLMWRGKIVRLVGEGARASRLMAAHNGWALDYAAERAAWLGVGLEVGAIGIEGLGPQAAAGAVRARFGRDGAAVRLSGMRLGAGLHGGVWLEHVRDTDLTDIVFSWNEGGAFVTIAGGCDGVLLRQVRHEGRGPSVVFTTQRGEAVFRHVDLLRCDFLTDTVAVQAARGVTVEGLFVADGVVAAPQTGMALDGVEQALICGTRFVATGAGNGPLVRVARSRGVTLSECGFTGRGSWVEGPAKVVACFAAGGPGP